MSDAQRVDEWWSLVLQELIQRLSDEVEYSHQAAIQFLQDGNMEMATRESLEALGLDNALDILKRHVKHRDPFTDLGIER